MVSTSPPTFKSSSPFSNPLITVPNAPVTMDIIVTCMFHRFFNFVARSRYLYFFSHSFSLIRWSAGTAKSTILQVLFFLLIIIRSGLLAEIYDYYYHIYYYLTPNEFFTPALACDFSLEFEWVQVSSCLQDSSQYSGLQNSCVAINEETKTLLFIKIYLSSLLSRKGRMVVSERDRETGRPRHGRLLW